MKRDKCFVIHGSLIQPITKIYINLFQVSHDYKMCSLSLVNTKGNIFLRLKEASLKPFFFLPMNFGNVSVQFLYVINRFSQTRKSVLRKLSIPNRILTAA